MTQFIAGKPGETGPIGKPGIIGPAGEQGKNLIVINTGRNLALDQNLLDFITATIL